MIIPVIFYEPDHRFSGRSSSAWAKLNPSRHWFEWRVKRERFAKDLIGLFQLALFAFQGLRLSLQMISQII